MDPLIFTNRRPGAVLQTLWRATQENVIQFLAFDDKNPNSIISCLRSARENARTVREMISSHMWEELNKFFLMVRNAKTDKQVLESPFEFFTQIKLAAIC